MMNSPAPYKIPHALYWVLVLLMTTLACATISRGIPTVSSPAAPSPTAPSPLTVPSPNGLIAYIGIDGNIYTIEENSAHNTPITQDAQQTAGSTIRLYQHPTWSHDGRHLAFVALEANEGEQTSRVLVGDPTTGETTEVFSHEEESPFYLYWAPDNERISFLTSAVTSPSLFLRLAFLNGDASRVADTGQPYYWVWSPDSTQIFVHEGGSTFANPNARVARFSSEDGRTQTFDLEPGNFQAPEWSPNGEQLLVAIEGEQQSSLALLDQEGTITQNVAEFIATIAFNWSPDGEWIAYRATTVESGGFFGPLTVIATDNPDKQQTPPEKTVLAYFWAPDSQKIAYFTPDSSEGIDALISTQAQTAFQMVLNVMDVQTGDTRRLAAFQPTDPFISILPFFDQYHHSATIWSPDSTKLVYPAINGEGEPSIWVIPAAGGIPTPIANGVQAFWSWK